MTSIRRLERNCLFCQKPFQAAVKHINAGNGRYCSRSCSGKAGNPYKARQPNVTCAYCHKGFWIHNTRIKLSKSGLYFCCREHKDVASRLGGIEAIQPDHYGKSEILGYREMAFRHYPKVCNRCGFDKFVIVHHKDRDRSNNKIENLEVLCPNCHALEHHCSGMA